MKIPFIYVYHGEKYKDEAVASILSLLKSQPDASIYVVCPAGSETGISSVRHIFLPVTDRVNGFYYKIKGMKMIEESMFVYLDTDTTILSGLGSLSEFVEMAGVSGVADPLTCTFSAIKALKRPSSWSSVTSLPEINTGVLCFNKSRLPPRFFDLWESKHIELIASNGSMHIGSVPDQPSFLHAVKCSGLLPLYLGSEYNFRACYPQMVHNPVLISHAHKNSGAAFLTHSPVQCREVAITTPWGLVIRRTGLVNRAFFFIKRKFYNFMGGEK